MTTAWAATHTGLPSLHLTQDLTVTTTSGRTLRVQGEDQPLFISDALAVPGEETGYVVGGRTFTVKRAPAKDRRAGVIAGRDGRPVPGVLLVDNADPLSWKSEAVRHASGIVRWPLRSQVITGESQIVLLDPSCEAQLAEVIYSRGVTYIGPATPTKGVSLRAVVITDAKRTRMRLGRIRYSIDWMLVDGRLAKSAAGRGVVPLLTWGDWAAYRALTDDLADYSYTELAQKIAGMPS